MKVVLFLLILSPFALGKNNYEDQRLCPFGYSYAGDDTTQEDLDKLGIPKPRDYYYEEVARSPEYSCYKLVNNDQTDFLEATHRCTADEGTLVSFEDPIEMARVVRYFWPQTSVEDSSKHDSKPEYELEFLTSGMFFDDVKMWYWTGGNKSGKVEMPVEGEEQGDHSKPKDCLNLRMPTDDANLPREDLEDWEDLVYLKATRCFSKNYFMCETRVQTVTYYAWFYANWVDMLLGFLIVILFVALCVSVCAYTSNDYGRRSARRRQVATETQRARVDVPTAVIDLPPSYESTTQVKFHHPENNDVTQQQMGKMTYYKNKGKELIGKVYVYKPTSSTNTR